jgi:hypothetical protein
MARVTNDRDDKRQQRRNSFLERALQRPCDRHRKQGECHRCHDRLRIIKRGESDYRCDQQERNSYDAIVLHDQGSLILPLA